MASVLDLTGVINQMTVFEIIIAVLHCLSNCVLAYYARSCKCCCDLGLCLASSAHVTRARYRMISGHSDNRKAEDTAINIAISPNRCEAYIFPSMHLAPADLDGPGSPGYELFWNKGNKQV